MSFTPGFDVTAAFFSQVPQGFQLAGYDTGDDGIAWTQEMWDAHPGAIHVDQAPDLDGDVTADVLDCEDGAIAVGSPLIPQWVQNAQVSYAAAVRPGQRTPSLYCSLSNVTPNVNALVDGGVTSGVGLWVADWALSSGQAVAGLLAAAGPFPLTGFQFNDDGDFDSDVWSTAWLTAVSGDGWVFGPVRNAVFEFGVTSFSVTGLSPGTPEPLGVGYYQVVACEGPALAAVLLSYPRLVPKSDATPAFSFQGGSLPSGTLVTAGVRAVAADGSHAGPWVTATGMTG